MIGSRRTAALALCLSLALGVALSAPASAEERTVVVLGVNGFTPPKSLSAQRQNATVEGIRAAVYRVVADSLPALDAEAAGAVARKHFRKDARDFVTRFRVVEDLGVQEKRYSSNRRATHEYVVRIEASVDARQVRQRLVGVGLLASGSGSMHRVELTLEELPSYAALEQIRLALIDQLRAEAATPIEFTSGRAVLAVRTRSDGRQLLERLAAADLAGFRVEPRAAGPDEAVGVVRAR
ncbi:MAG: hypothetical protein JRH10_14440 [Deltaproteobacteria bacterium]|nr:hypothetical protein [Deltaproteobacteria bacterium]